MAARAPDIEMAFQEKKNKERKQEKGKEESDVPFLTSTYWLGLLISLTGMFYMAAAGFKCGCEMLPFHWAHYRFE